MTSQEARAHPLFCSPTSVLTMPIHPIPNLQPSKQAGAERVCPRSQREYLEKWGSNLYLTESRDPAPVQGRSDCNTSRPHRLVTDVDGVVCQTTWARRI